MGSSLGWRLMAGKAKGTLDNWKNRILLETEQPPGTYIILRAIFSPMPPPPQQISCFYRFPLSAGRRYPQPLCGYLPFGDAGYNRNEIRWYPRYQSRHCDRFSFFFCDFYFYFFIRTRTPGAFFISHGNRLGWPRCTSHFSLVAPRSVCH